MMKVMSGDTDMNTGLPAPAGGCGSKTCPISRTTCPGECIFSYVLENISVGIIVFDVSRETVIFENSFAVEILGDRVRPKDYHAILALFSLSQEFPRGEKVSVPMSLTHEGKLLGYTLYHVKGEYLWLFIRDVTEKMRLESVAEAINSMNNIGYVFSGVRHEIGNPVNSIKTSLSVLAHNLETFPKETVRTYIERAMGEVGRVEYLLRTMKSFNMYECPDLEDVEMVPFMEKFLTIVMGDFRTRGIELVSIIHPEVSRVRVDPRALHQVLLNILTNASDACEDRHEAKIVISLFRRDTMVCISIMDNGPGIPRDQQEKLFIPFFTTKMNGTGLGLTIVKKMLAKMDGTISVASQEEGGTIVDIWIPAGLHGRP